MTRMTSAVAAMVSWIVIAGCRDHKLPANGLRMYVFVDDSASVSPAQRAMWQRDAERLLHRIGPGWHITMFPVNGQTGAAGALFDMEVPALSSDPQLDERQHNRALLLRTREGVKGAFGRAFTEGGHAESTDILSAIDRIHPDSSGRTTAVVFFSDMLNATRELNMERADRFGRDRFAGVIQSAAQNHNWSSDQLRGIDIYCVLNSAGLRDSGASALRRVSREFYEALFSALGGRLRLFETQLDLNATTFSRGGTDAHNETR